MITPVPQLTFHIPNSYMFNLRINSFFKELLLKNLSNSCNMVTIIIISYRIFFLINLKVKIALMTI